MIDNRPEEAYDIAYSHSVLVIVLSLMSMAMNILCVTLIMSNAIRLLKRKMFKTLISLFYVFTLLAVMGNCFSYTIILYWVLFKTPEEKVDHKEEIAFEASLFCANFSQYFLLASTILTMYQLTLALQILLKEITEA